MNPLRADSFRLAKKPEIRYTGARNLHFSGMENVIRPDFGARPGGEAAGEGKMLEFKRKLEEESPEPGLELKEKVSLEVSGADLHAILVGLTHERNALKRQRDEILGDPDLADAFGPMIEGLLEKNAELLGRLASQDPALEAQFKKQL